MKITKKEVKKIADLAKLALTDEEKEKFTRQLGEILAYMEILNRVNTENIPPAYHIHETKNVFRKDQSEKWLNQDEATANAPKKFKGYFSVPKVIRKG
ncbi:MAG TPA: Asp-tRNA(Asn)/Glu-tRNA(Gln) amidotransferase subunit GatC [Bacteroidetes bacterium]|nr:Asp-tRNA(Asn)/Glu-tRNA(Gln) amidotransferase subunit GatC [Bacteroidota bacterium]